LAEEERGFVFFCFFFFFFSFSGDVSEERDVTCCLPVRWMCLIAYATGLVGGLLVALMEKRSYYCVFHACQSVIVCSIYVTFAIVFGLIDNLVIHSLSFSVISFVWFCLYLILMIVCIVFAWKNEQSEDLFQIIGLGRLAEKMADKLFTSCNPNNINEADFQ
jgi:uncharacterized membrane protein